jgi:trehalose 6-phosphate phosphatase
MKYSVTSLLPRIHDLFLSGESTLLLFEYDGTLVPYAAHPDFAKLSSENRILLGELSQMPHCTVGVMSNRSLDDLKGLIRLDSLVYLGSGGLEIEMDEDRWFHPQLDHYRPSLMKARTRLEATCIHYPGTWIEEKPFGLTAHFRGLPSIASQCFCEDVVEALESGKLMTSLRCHPGVLSIEIGPAFDWNRSHGIRMILDQRPSVVDIFFGNEEASDLEPIRYINSIGGITIGVGPNPPTEANYHIESCSGLTQCLRELIPIEESLDWTEWHKEESNLDLEEAVLEKLIDDPSTCAYA